MRTDVIASFRDEFAFLSNFDMNPFVWRDDVFPSGEHAFSWAKGYHIQDGYLQDIAVYQQKVLDAPTPAKAKALGRAVNLDVKSWDNAKVQVMRDLTHAKFLGVKGYAGKLINTGAAMLVEGNDWGDTFWGRSRNKDGKFVGLNVLGAILMEERGYWLRGHLNV